MRQFVELRGEIHKMKTRVRHGVIGIIIITMGTSLMVVYNSSFSNTSWYRSDAAGPPMVKLKKPQRKPPRPLTSIHEGYTGVIDKKCEKYGENISSHSSVKGQRVSQVALDKRGYKEWKIGLNPNMVSGAVHFSLYNGYKLRPCLKPKRFSISNLPLKIKPLRMHCNCCALVTSSGHLTGSRRGADIDRNECVIRMNDAPTSGFQRDVGRRTSLRVIAHSSLQRVLRSRQELLNASQDQDTVFLFWGPSSCMRRDGKGLVYNNLRLVNQLLPKLKVYIISRLKMLQFDELFKKETGKDRRISNSWLSTGWFSMAIALELCDRINVYGMVAPDFCRSPSEPSVPYHYYEPSGPDECSMYLSHERSRHGSHHRFITEKTVFANWARTFDIHFYQPDWSPSASTSTPLYGNSSHSPSPDSS